MHSAKTMTRSILSALLVIATAGSPVFAADHDRVYADSFGNLVIEAAAGYKRIIVGEGDQAKDLARYTSSGQPDVVYADGNGSAQADCYRAPYLVKGRSYMYGFDQGEIPFQGGPCQ
jgi:hypothetical protein